MSSLLECTENEIQLVSMEGENATEGRLEICHEGVWGTACPRSLDPKDASVVCRELGFNATGMHVQCVVYHSLILPTHVIRQNESL